MAFNPEEFDSLVAELLQNEGATDDKAKPKPEDGFQIHLGGKDYKFATQQEAERALETHMARLETTARDATTRAEAANRPPPEPAAPPLKDGEVSPWTKEFVASLEKGDSKNIARLILKDGVFDGKIDDPASVLTDSLLRTAQMDRGHAVNTFLSAHADLHNNPTAQSAVEQARTFLGLPATPDGFEAAHAYAERRQMIPSSTPPQQTGRGAPPAPPRSTSGTGAAGPQTPEEWESFYESRSDADLEKLMKAAYANR